MRKKFSYILNEIKYYTLYKIIIYKFITYVICYIKHNTIDRIRHYFYVPVTTDYSVLSLRQ